MLTEREKHAFAAYNINLCVYVRKVGVCMYISFEINLYYTLDVAFFN